MRAVGRAAIVKQEYRDKMSRAVPVSLANPSAPVDNSSQWLELGKLANANPEFTALELKAFYVIGLIDDICQSVDWLLKAEDAWPEKYLPAFSVFASGVDLLGRCLTGNWNTGSQENLKVGFHYLAQPSLAPPEKRLLSTTAKSSIVHQTNVTKYTVSDLVDLRNYTAHGQATTGNTLPGVHIELLDHFPKLIGDAMGIYWRGLQNIEEYCLRLGNAKISAYSNRAKPLRDTLEYFSVPGNSIGGLFYRLNWQIGI